MVSRMAPAMSAQMAKDIVDSGEQRARGRTSGDDLVTDEDRVGAVERKGA